MGISTVLRWRAIDIEVEVTASNRVLFELPCGDQRFMDADEAIALAKKIFNAASLAKINKQRAERGHATPDLDSMTALGVRKAMADALAENG